MRSTDWSCAWVGSLFIYLVGVGFIGSRDGHGFFSLALLNFDPLGRWTLSLCFLFLGSYLDLLSTLYYHRIIVILSGTASLLLELRPKWWLFWVYSTAASRILPALQWQLGSLTDQWQRVLQLASIGCEKRALGAVTALLPGFAPYQITGILDGRMFWDYTYINILVLSSSSLTA